MSLVAKGLVLIGQFLCPPGLSLIGQFLVPLLPGQFSVEVLAEVLEPPPNRGCSAQHSDVRG